jgi:hypothetical protein
MNQEMPHLDRALGEQPDRQELFEEFLTNHHITEGGKEIVGEIEKSSRDQKIIDLADQVIDQYLQEFGRKKQITLSGDHIHIFPEGGVSHLTEGNTEEGAHSTTLGSIMVDRKKSDLDFALRVFHELTHAKVYNAVQYIEGDETNIQDYRSGWKIVSRDGKEEYFKDLEEALISYNTERFYREVLIHDKSFEEEINRLHNSGQEVDFGRLKEGAEWEKVLDALWAVNAENFTSKEAIRKLFLQAQATGNIFPMARLVEKSFGKGSFRFLGENFGKN